MIAPLRSASDQEYSSRLSGADFWWPYVAEILPGACDWQVGKDFPRQALGLAQHRQAFGRAQHHTMDVFEPVAAVFPLQDIGTLDELATELFAV